MLEDYAKPAEIRREKEHFFLMALNHYLREDSGRVIKGTVSEKVKPFCF